MRYRAGEQCATLIFVSQPQVGERLRRQRRHIVSEVVDAVWDHLPGYSADRLERADLERFVEPHVDLVITLLSAGRAPTVEEAAYARELGQSRALQGVPVESVVHSFRLAEHAVLRLLLRNAEDLPRTVLTEAIEGLIRAFDALIADSTAAYRVAQEEVAKHYEQLERGLVADLATGGEARIAQAESQARLLGSKPDTAHIAIALSPGEREAGGRRQMLSALAPGISGRILHGVVGGWGMLLLPVGALAAIDVVQMVRRAMRASPWAQDSACGVGTIAPRLGSVRSSCQQAVVAAEVGMAQSSGSSSAVVSFDDVLVEAALLADHRVAERLVTAVLGGLADQPTLLETLRTYLASDLSQTRTATELVVHPNTVAYRLDRISQITGHDVRRVSQAMTLMVAVRAYDLLAAQTSRTSDAAAHR